MTWDDFTNQARKYAVSAPHLVKQVVHMLKAVARDGFKSALFVLFSPHSFLTILSTVFYFWHPYMQ